LDDARSRRASVVRFRQQHLTLDMLGAGILKGMVETARNFAGSYTSEERLVTVEYPEERIPPKEAARNFPFLI